MWFWIFFVYSFLGFVLEKLFAWVTGGDRERKCLLVLPLCPVYGLGALAVLWLRPLAGGSRVALFLLGAAACTAVEYAVSWWYERFLRVSFWDYSSLPWNLRGRVCPPFSLLWGALSLLLVRVVHPGLEPLLLRLPPAVGAAAALTLLWDSLVTYVLLRRGGGKESLRFFFGKNLDRGRKAW